MKSLRKKVAQLESSDARHFRDFVDPEGKPKQGVLRYPGAYIVYEGGKPIYIGSAGKGKHFLRYRIADLFHKTKSKGEVKYYHTLTRKLLHGEGKLKFDNLHEVRNYYFEKCRVKIIETQDIDEAKAIEHILIKLLRCAGTLLNG